MPLKGCGFRQLNATGSGTCMDAFNQLLIAPAMWNVESIPDRCMTLCNVKGSRLAVAFACNAELPWGLEGHDMMQAYSSCCILRGVDYLVAMYPVQHPRGASGCRRRTYLLIKGRIPREQRLYLAKDGVSCNGICLAALKLFDHLCHVLLS